jgi:hypothetical protein
VTPKSIFLTVVIATCLAACMTAKKLDPPTLSKYEGFICDGKTTKQEVLDRLGFSANAYEKDTILIYHAYLQDDGRMTLAGPGTCHALVLVFDKENVLERHSLVKHGCR